MIVSVFQSTVLMDGPMTLRYSSAKTWIERRVTPVTWYWHVLDVWPQSQLSKNIIYNRMTKLECEVVKARVQGLLSPKTG